MKALLRIWLALWLAVLPVSAAEINDLDVTDNNNVARFPEGMTFANVNNSARALEGILARWHKDVNGSLTTGGSSNAYTLAANETITAYYSGLWLRAKANFTNTGAATLNGDSVGAVAIKKGGTTDVAAGDIQQDHIYDFVYDGTNWQLLNFGFTAYVKSLLVAADAAAARATLGIGDATETDAGLVEMATNAEIRAATTGAKAIMAEDLETAAAPVALSDAATVAVDWDAGINFTVTLGGNRTLGNPTNGQPGNWRRIQVTQDGTGSRTLAYGNQYVFAGGTEPVLTTAAASVDVLWVYCRTASIFEVYSALDLKQ